MNLGPYGQLLAGTTLGPYGQALSMQESKRMMESMLFRASSGKFMKMQASDATTDEKKGWKWDVVVFAFGESSVTREDGYVNVYPKKVGDESVPLFEGASVYANAEGDYAGHKTNPNEKVTPDIIGVLTDVRTTDEAMLATLNILPSGNWLRENLMFIEANSLPNPFELSIDAGGYGTKVIEGDKKMFVATEIKRAAVDVVNKGAAGGKFVRMAASRVAA